MRMLSISPYVHCFQSCTPYVEVIMLLLSLLQLVHPNGHHLVCYERSHDLCHQCRQLQSYDEGPQRQMFMCVCLVCLIEHPYCYCYVKYIADPVKLYVSLQMKENTYKRLTFVNTILIKYNILTGVENLSLADCNKYYVSLSSISLYQSQFSQLQKILHLEILISLFSFADLSVSKAHHIT